MCSMCYNGCMDNLKLWHVQMVQGPYGNTPEEAAKRAEEEPAHKYHNLKADQNSVRLIG